MASDKVIVFGPTGGVGSVTALVAREHGAQVVLAMRDPQKPIPGLSPEQEQAGGFERVQADLTNPDTVRAAVRQTGAKRAFIYLIYGQPDGMRSSLEALKSAGVDFAVFLSSWSVHGDLASIPPAEFIPYQHAQTEIALNDVYGPDGYVSLRAGAFTTNVLQYRRYFASGVVKVPYPQLVFDFIAPEDIGRVGGAILAKGPSALDSSKPDKHLMDLCGPNLISTGEAIGIIGKVIGKDLKVEHLGDDDVILRSFMDNLGLPEIGAKALLKATRDLVELDNGHGYWPRESPRYQEGLANIKKYGGKEPIRFEQWAERNKAKLVA